VDKKDSYVKELGHQMNIFLKAYEIKSIIHVHAQMVLTFLACLVQEWMQCHSGSPRYVC
jgi:hypothetical protein